MSIYQQTMVRLHMAKMAMGPWARLKRYARDPARTQAALLQRILRAHSDTQFGNQYRFPTLTDARSYTATVPMHDYEALRPFIDRQMQGQEAILTAESPCHYLLTSGTTGQPKHLPLTKSALRHLRDCQQLAAYNHFREAPLLFSGRLLSMTGAGTEGHLPSGVPYGCLSGVLLDAMTGFMRRRSLPSAALEHRYEAIAREAAAAPDITAAITANPSSFLRLKEWMVREGVLSADSRLGDLWPNLQAIITWTHGNCAPYIPALRQEFPNATILEAGYLASELYGTIPIGQGRCVPALGHYFFEFIEVSAWDEGIRETQLLHALEQGKRYYVIVTSESGLYRYSMHDIVETDGMFQNTPCLRFVQKGKGVTSVTGEKLYEGQLLLAMEKVWGHTPDAAFFLALAHRDPAHYRLYVESPHIQADMAERVDAALASFNIEYKAKRDSGRLQPLRLMSLTRGAGEAYRQHCIDHGQRDAQWKIIRLHHADACHFDFTPFLQEPS
ncbi:MAG: GH3 auxin-responsive promoter family protein [Pseudomonadota bacterium]